MRTSSLHFVVLVAAITEITVLLSVGCSVSKSLFADADEDQYFEPLDTLPNGSKTKIPDFSLERQRYEKELTARDRTIDSLRKSNQFLYDHITQLEKKPENPPTTLRTTELVLEKGRNIVLEGVNFQKGKATLDKSSDAVLKKAYSALVAYIDAEVEIAGYTDNQGNPEANDNLSMKRAQAVREWFVKKGIDPKRLTVKGLGPRDPLATNDTPEGRAKNRRIEFHVK